MSDKILGFTRLKNQTRFQSFSFLIILM